MTIQRQNMKVQDFGERPIIVATLKPRWVYNESARVFETQSRKKSVSPWSDLPEGSYIAYTVARLAKLPRSTLSATQRRLTRSVQIVLPAAVKAESYVTAVMAWPAVLNAHVGPRATVPALGAQSLRPPAPAN